MKHIKLILITALIAGLATGCGADKTDTAHERFNETAAVTGQLGDLPAASILSWHMVTLLKSNRAKTISVLYANDLAYPAVLERSGAYPDGASLALVTWLEKPDIHWFGATIPGEVASVEKVSVKAAKNGQLITGYVSFIKKEKGLQRVSGIDSSLIRKNTNFILGLRRPYLPD